MKITNLFNFLYSNDDEGKVLLGKLARINKPLEISFFDMLRLMQQCTQVDKQHELSKRKVSNFEALYERNTDLNDPNVQGDEPVTPKPKESNENRGILSGNPFSLFSGVFPGTKWCGTGDIAKNFHDLGEVGKILNFPKISF